MRAGLATLDVLVKENLGPRALAMGDQLRDRLREELSGYEMIQEVRGLGCSPASFSVRPNNCGCAWRLNLSAIFIPAMFGQVLVMRMFRDQRVLMQMCGNNFMVLKVAPPLIIQAGADREVREQHS